MIISLQFNEKLSGRRHWNNNKIMAASRRSTVAAG